MRYKSRPSMIRGPSYRFGQENGFGPVRIAQAGKQPRRGMVSISVSSPPVCVERDVNMAEAQRLAGAHAYSVNEVCSTLDELYAHA